MIENRFDPGPNDRVATTTVTSFRLLEALYRLGGATARELATELDLAVGTVYKHLNTLQGLHYVVKDGSVYHLGLGFLGVGVAARARSGLYELTHEPLAELAETARGVASVVLPEHGYGVYLSQIVPPDAQSPPHHEGERVYLHATAGGKAILAFRPPAEVDRWLDVWGLPAVTEATVTDRERLQRELQSIRDRRFASSRGEDFEDWFSVAMPITDEDDLAVGAVCLGTPLDRVDSSSDADRFKSLIINAAVSMENRIGSTDETE